MATTIASLTRWAIYVQTGLTVIKVVGESWAFFRPYFRQWTEQQYEPGSSNQSNQYREYSIIVRHGRRESVDISSELANRSGQTISVRPYNGTVTDAEFIPQPSASDDIYVEEIHHELLENYDEKCYVCDTKMDENDPDRPIASLPLCSHTFHKKCVDSMLALLNNTCPRCRQSIICPI